MTEVNLEDVVKWLNAEIQKQQKALDGLAASKRQLGQQIAEQMEKKKKLETSLATVKQDLEKTIANANTAHMSKEGEIHELTDKNKEQQSLYDVIQKDREALDKQLADAKEQAKPFLCKIELLKGEIKELKDKIDKQKQLVAEKNVVPTEIEKLRERCDRALAQKPGFLQKLAFAEELINESESLHKSVNTKYLQDYKQLCEDLKVMVFEEQGTGK